MLRPLVAPPAKRSVQGKLVAMQPRLFALAIIAVVHGGVIRTESSALTIARATNTRPTHARAELRHCRAQVGMLPCRMVSRPPPRRPRPNAHATSVRPRRATAVADFATLITCAPRPRLTARATCST